MASLKQKMAEAVAWAEAHPGEAYRVPLTHGLRVDVKITKLTMLQLSRRDVYPAALELKTVLEAWPYAVDVSLAGKQMPYQGRHYLMCHWPTPERLVEAAHE